MAEETKTKKQIKKPKEFKQPTARTQITPKFINSFFAYKENIASYNYSINQTEENKKILEDAKQEHINWLSTVENAYNGKVSESKTKKLIKNFTDKYYPNLPKRLLGEFK